MSAMVQENPQVHEAADLFPLMGDSDLDVLARDIEINGQQEPVIMYKGKILDGRNRWRACMRIGKPCATQELNPSEDFDPFNYAVSRNLHRRHLSESQRAMVALELEKHFAEAAEERKKSGKSADGKAGGRGNKKENPTDNCPEGSESREIAAKQLNISGRLISRAKKVRKDCPPETVEKVRSGEISINKALSSIVAKDAAVAEKAEPISPIQKRIAAIWNEMTPEDQKWFRLYIRSK